MTKSRKATKKSSIDVADFDDLWNSLTHNQQRYAVALMDYKSRKEAAEAVGVKPDTAYHWNGDVDLAVEQMRRNARDSAVSILANALVKAVMVKLAGLESGNEDLRQNVASEIMDRVLGKAKQAIGIDANITQEITHSLDLTQLTDRELDVLEQLATKLISG